MQEAIPFRGPHPSPASQSSGITVATNSEGLKRLIAENPVLVVGRRGCCMCHVVKHLLLGLGVNPAACDVGDEIHEGSLMEEFSVTATTTTMQNPVMLFPAVFIGGRLVGGLDRLMAVHISGDLVPILKDAGALWL